MLKKKNTNNVRLINVTQSHFYCSNQSIEVTEVILHDTYVILTHIEPAHQFFGLSERRANRVQYQDTFYASAVCWRLRIGFDTQNAAAQSIEYSGPSGLIGCVLTADDRYISTDIYLDETHSPQYILPKHPRSDIIPKEEGLFHPPFKDKKGRTRKRQRWNLVISRSDRTPSSLVSRGRKKEFNSAVKSAIKVATTDANVLCEPVALE